VVAPGLAVADGLVDRPLSRPGAIGRVDRDAHAAFLALPLGEGHGEATSVAVPGADDQGSAERPRRSAAIRPATPRWVSSRTLHVPMDLVGPLAEGQVTGRVEPLAVGLLD
jgi:hypothetical protein